jgi:hypothetical protein
MKTLTALKREATKFKWSMFRTNSFFLPIIPDFLKAYRKVTRVQADRIAFETVKNGEVIESWGTFPKAKQVEIVEDSIFSPQSYFVKFTQDNGTFIQYHIVEAE